MKIYHLQTNFNSGELDERMSGRLDTKQYQQGMRIAQNVLNIPQGGVKRRQGQVYIDDVGSFGNVVSFVFNTEISFAIVFTDLSIAIYKDDILVDTVVSPYLEADLMDIDVIQSQDTMLVVHPDYEPRNLFRIADNNWTLTTLTFVNIPQFDFDDTDSPTPTDEIQTFTFSAFGPGDLFKMNLEGIDTADIPLSLSTADNAAEVQAALTDLVNTPSTGISVVFDSGTTYIVTFSGASARPWRLMTGRATVSADPVAAIATARTQTGVSRAEDVWSNTRGWPVTVTFHENRLWFGGSAQRPITLWGSNVGDFFNFDAGKGRADQAINATLDISKLNQIVGLFSGRNLQIFTTGAEHYIPSSPITPENIAVNKQTDFGAKKIQPRTIDGAVLYVQRTGKAIQQFAFDFLEDAYQSGSITLLNPSIINDPVDLDVQPGSSSSDANYVYVVNSTGRMSVFNTLRSENIAGWTQWITDGEIQSVAVVIDDVYLTVKRVVGGVDVFYLEKIVDAALLDSSKLYTGVNSATLTGLSHLEGRVVRIVADGSVMEDQTVVGGEVTTERVAINAEVGLDLVSDNPEFPVIVENMPLEQDLGAGVNLDADKRVVKCTVQLEETSGIFIGASVDREITSIYPVPFRTFGANVLDSPAPLFTGKKDMRLSGWGTTVGVVVAQKDPAPMVLLSMTLEVEVND